MTAVLVAEVRDFGGDPAVVQLLQLAGSPRTVAYLTDTTNWISYNEAVALWQAGSRVTHNPRFPQLVGERAAERMSSSPVATLLRSLGSPEKLYEQIARSSVKFSTVARLAAVEVKPGSAEIAAFPLDGFHRSAEHCAWTTGLLSCSPVLFGMPPSRVEHSVCAAFGAPECRYRITWVPEGEAGPEGDRGVEALRGQLEGMQERLQNVFATASDLIASDDIADVLARITDRAAIQVRATRYLLAVRFEPLGEIHCHARGFGDGDAEFDAERILQSADADYPESWLVVPVRSDRREYGRLVAVSGSDVGFFPQEREVLEVYARYAASALDGAAALIEARRRDDESRALLKLASAIATAASGGEVAHKLAGAVPLVVSCDRVEVYLNESSSKKLVRRAAVSGAARDPTLAEVCKAGDLERLLDSGHPEPVFIDARSGDLPVRRALERRGDAAAILVPILVQGSMVGALVLSVSSESERLRRNPELLNRLSGVVAHASAALQNARLLDHITHQAMHDQLTELPNRALVLDRVEQMLARARRQRLPAAVLFIDIDGFKHVNDGFGHAAGDALLQEIAARLRGAVRESDTVGRLSGDEFVVLTESLTIGAAPKLVAEHVLDVLRQPIELDAEGSRKLTISASVGIAVGENQAAEQLLNEADIALYEAKRAGKGCAVVFDSGMAHLAQTRLLLKMDLPEALERDELFLVYQPVLDLESQAIVGVEALARWRHPTLGVVEPAEFIPIAEETGDIVPVGRWVLGQATRQAAGWRQNGAPVTIAVNVSARQLDDPQFVDDVREALTDNGLDPGTLTLEITESALMKNSVANTRQLGKLRQLGVRIAIDDFGTGYSSMAYLRQFPIDVLKIDRSFIAAIGSSTQSKTLVQTLVQLAKALGIDTVAEGIEHQGQLDVLQAEKCELGQGFLFAPPLDAPAIQRLLQNPEALIA